MADKWKKERRILALLVIAAVFTGLLPGMAVADGLADTSGESANTVQIMTTKVDKTTLQSKVNEAKAITRGSYTEASWNALQSAIGAAESVLNNAEATQEEVNAEVTALTNAIDGLIQAGQALTATAGGTLQGATEGDINIGGKTLVITLENGVFAADAVSSDANREALIAGLKADSSSSAWNPVLEALRANPGSVERTSDTEITITLPAVSGYDIPSDQTISVTIPQAVISGAGGDVLAQPSLVIRAMGDFRAYIAGTTNILPETVQQEGLNLTINLERAKFAEQSVIDANKNSIIDNMVAEAVTPAYGEAAKADWAKVQNKLKADGSLTVMDGGTSLQISCGPVGDLNGPVGAITENADYAVNVTLPENVVAGKGVVALDNHLLVMEMKADISIVDGNGVSTDLTESDIKNGTSKKVVLTTNYTFSRQAIPERITAFIPPGFTTNLTNAADDAGWLLVENQWVNDYTNLISPNTTASKTETQLTFSFPAGGIPDFAIADDLTVYYRMTGGCFSGTGQIYAEGEPFWGLDGRVNFTIKKNSPILFNTSGRAMTVVKGSTIETDCSTDPAGGTISISGEQGVSAVYENGKIRITGTAAGMGSFTINADIGGATYSRTVTVNVVDTVITINFNTQGKVLTIQKGGSATFDCSTTPAADSITIKNCSEGLSAFYDDGIITVNAADNAVNPATFDIMAYKTGGYAETAYTVSLEVRGRAIHFNNEGKALRVALDVPVEYTCTVTPDGEPTISGVSSNLEVAYSRGFVTVTARGTQAGNGVTGEFTINADGASPVPVTVNLAYLPGSGTEQDPYTLATAKQLDLVRNFTNITAYPYFKIIADIDLAGYTNLNSDTDNWLPIGMEASPFYGYIYGDKGNGEAPTIKNLQMDRSGYAGLFGYSGGMIARNINITLGTGGVKGTSSTGALAGNVYMPEAYMNGNFENLNVGTGTVTGGAQTGGLFGHLFGNPARIKAVTNCSAACDVNGGNYTGGLIGQTQEFTFDHCQATGNVSGGSYTGGLIGYAPMYGASNCSSSGNVTASCGTCGGLFGAAYGQGDCSITNCYAAGNVSGTGGEGGLIGNLSGTVVLISQCYALGNVTASSGGAVGGLIYMVNTGASITDCFAMGDVNSALNNAGGLIGLISDTSARVTRCYAYGNVTGADRVGGVAGTNNGKIENSFALNPAVTRNSGELTNFNRIAGSLGASATLFGNTAYEEMLVLGSKLSAGDAASPAGESRSSVALKRQETYSDHGWDFINTWKMHSKGYPILAWIDESAITVDNHLIDTGLVDKTMLKNVIDRAKAFDVDYYTPETWAALQAALTLAEAAYNNAEATQAEVDDRQTALESTIAGLKEKEWTRVINFNGDNKSQTAILDVPVQFACTVTPAGGEPAIASMSPNLEVSYSNGIITVTGKGTQAGSGVTGQFVVKADGARPLTVTMNFAYLLGSGTLDDPYLIASAKQLDLVRYYTNITSYPYFKITADIDLAGYTNLNGDTDNWFPIGTGSSPFYGYIYGDKGNGEAITINNLQMDRSGYAGLFGYSGGMIARNITIALGTGGIKGTDSTGALVGRVYMPTATISGHFENLSVGSGTVTGAKETGGIIGQLVANSSDAATFTNCSATCDVNGGMYTGGLIGDAHQLALSNCHASGNISGTSNCGGLIGKVIITGASNCSATGNVIVSKGGAGGLFGVLTANGECSVTNCFASGNVTGTATVGGLTGSMSGSLTTDISLSRCYALGNITATTGGTGGGLVGSLGTKAAFTDCFAMGNVNCATTNAGGLAGRIIDTSAQVSRCYAYGDVTGSNYVGGLAGQNNGRIDNSFALNSALDRSTGELSLFNRIAGSLGASGVLADNTAYAGMHVLGATRSADDAASLDGAASTAAILRSQTAYSAKGWDFVDTWKMHSKAYPILAWIDENSITVENHLLFQSPVLLADTTENLAGRAMVITFSDDASWRAVVSSVAVNGIALDAGQYSLVEGKLIIAPAVFAAAGDYQITVSAAGYADTSVLQIVNPAPKYTVTPETDPSYTVGSTPDGIPTMTVIDNISGLKYFTALVAPIYPHNGDEVVAFVHLRDNVQKALNATKADFDIVSYAQSGFNVLPFDMVKVFIVDDLTNAIDFNPTVLQ